MSKKKSAPNPTEIDAEAPIGKEPSRQIPNEIEAGKVSPGIASPVEVTPIEIKREGAAQNIATWLLGILAGMIIIHYASVAFVIWIYHGDCKTEGSKEVLEKVDHFFTTLLPVISGLVGSAVTYYFTREKARP